MLNWLRSKICEQGFGLSWDERHREYAGEVIGVPLYHSDDPGYLIATAHGLERLFDEVGVVHDADFISEQSGEYLLVSIEANLPGHEWAGRVQLVPMNKKEA